jgi:hypothetical protein
MACGERIDNWYNQLQDGRLPTPLQRMEAFAMVTCPRLGATSVFSKLPDDVMRLILGNSISHGTRIVDILAKWNDYNANARWVLLGIALQRVKYTFTSIFMEERPKIGQTKAKKYHVYCELVKSDLGTLIKEFYPLKTYGMVPFVPLSDVQVTNVFRNMTALVRDEMHMLPIDEAVHDLEGIHAVYDRLDQMPELQHFRNKQWRKYFFSGCKRRLGKCLKKAKIAQELYAKEGPSTKKKRFYRY